MATEARSEDAQHEGRVLDQRLLDETDIEIRLARAQSWLMILDRMNDAEEEDRRMHELQSELRHQARRSEQAAASHRLMYDEF